MAFRAKWPFERESDIYLVAIEDNMAKAGFYTYWNEGSLIERHLSN